MSFKDIDLSFFIGGQMEVQRLNPPRTRQGEIGSIRNMGARLLIELRWMAEGDGIPPKEWSKHDAVPWNLDYAHLIVASLNGGRVMFVDPSSRETVILHPLGGHAIDPSQVQGL